MISAPMGAEQTSIHAVEEDPGLRISDLLILLAAVASLAAVAVAVVMVHTLVTWRYAEVYYSDEPGGIGFNQQELPHYTEIA